MEKIDNLLIRQIKSNRCSYVKLRKLVGMKTAMDPKHIEPFDVLYWISELVQKYKPFDFMDFLHEMNPTQDYIYGTQMEDCDNEYCRKTLQRLTSRIRFIKICDLDDYKSPTRFKKPS